jgi:hypothetical protein
MTSDPNSSSLSPLVASLRAKTTTALLEKNRGEARALLGRLVSLSGNQNDKNNLSELIRGVKQEVDRHIAGGESFRNLLLNGTPLEDIQKGLSAKIPYWRAFANDLPDLQLARNGLPAHEDPVLKQRLKAMEGKLAAGAVDEVLQEWMELGALSAAADGGFAQMMDVLCGLSEAWAGKEWAMAKTIRIEAVRLLDSDGSVSYRQGCENYLRKVETQLGWESYFEAKSDISKLSKLDRQTALKELNEAKSQFEKFSQTDSWGKETLQRMNNTIESIQQLEERIKAIENKLAEGKVVEVVAEWEKLGKLSAAADVGFAQVVDVLNRLLKAMEGKNWATSEIIRAEALERLASDNSVSYRQGCKDYLMRVENKLGWERLLEKTTNPSTLSKPERLKVLEELHTAQVQLGLSTDTDPSVKETLERVEKTIERIEQIPDEPPKEDGGVKELKILVVLLVLVVAGALGCWVWSSRFAPN